MYSLPIHENRSSDKGTTVVEAHHWKGVNFVPDTLTQLSLWLCKHRIDHNKGPCTPYTRSTANKTAIKTMP